MEHESRLRRMWRPLIAVVAALGAVGIAACGSSGSSSSSSTPSTGSAASTTGSKSGGTINVGFTPSLSGFNAPFDSEVLKGARIEANKLNSSGGPWKINLNVEDGASDPSKQRVATQDLLSKGINFLIGSCSGAVSTPSAILAASQKVPTVLTCAGDSQFPKKVGPYGFLGNAGALAMGSALGKFAVDKGWKRAYLVGSTSNEYTTQITNGFKKGYQDLGGKITSQDSVEIFKQSYAPAIDKIKAAGNNYDVIMTPLFVPDAVTFLKELRGAGITKPVLLDDGGDTPLLFSGGDPGKVYVATFGFPQPGNKLATFEQEYQAKYGKKPAAVQPGIGADLVDLIAAAAAKAGTNDSTKLRDAFAQLANVPAVTATVSYTGAGYGPGLQRHPLAIETPAPNGKSFVFAATVDPDPANVPKP